MAKSGSKLIVGLISFLLGFLFALLAEIGAIVGVYFYVTTQDIDSLLAAVGLPNRDADGNNIYINTDPDNGGAKTIKDLIACLQDLLYDDGQLSILSKSFNDFEELIPATGMLLNMLYDAVGDFITIDSEKFESVPLTDVAQVLADSILNVHVGSLLDKIGGSSITDTNIIVRSLLLGAETEYASVVNADASAEFKLPVLYDIYTYDGDFGWQREKSVKVDDSDRTFNGFPDNLTEGGRNQDEFIEVTTVNDRPDGELTYRTGKLCYVPCRVTEEGIFPANYELATYIYKDYAFQYIAYAEDTDFITVQANKDGNYVLDYDEIWAINPDSAFTGDRSYRFTGYSYYDAYGRNYYYIEDDGTNRPDLKTISGKNFFCDSDGNLVQLDPLTLSDLIYNAFGPLYSITITEVVGDNADIASDIFGKTTLGDLLDGNVNFDNLVGDMELSTLINNVRYDNKLMAYIVFKLTDIKYENGAYTAIFDKDGADKEVYVEVDGDGYISYAYDKNGVTLDGVKFSEVADVVANLTGVLTIGDVMTVDGSNRILSALAGTKINAIGDSIKTLTVGDLFDEEDIKASAILRQLKNSTLETLSDDIDGVLIQWIYAKEIYGLEDPSDPERTEFDPEVATEFHEEWLYYVEDNGVFRLAGEGGHISSTEFEDGGITYYTYGQAKGMWKLILYVNGKEQAYHINNFSNMIAESTKNIYGATLGELQDAGIISAEVKGKKFTYPTDTAGGTNTVDLESLSLSDLIDIVLSMSTAE